MTALRTGWLAAMAGGILALTVLVPTLDSVRYVPQADEGSYLQYAVRVAQQGPEAMPELFREYLEGARTRQYYPTPIRLTTIAMQAVGVRLWGPSFESLQKISVIAFLLLLGVVALTISRMVGSSIALYTTLLLAVSPLHLAMARRALSDSLVATLTLASFCVLLRAIHQERWRLRTWCGIAALYTLTFLSREGSVTLAVLSLAALALGHRHPHAQSRVAPLCAVSILPLTLAATIVSVAAGGVATAWEALQITAASADSNAYALTYGGGPWFRYVVDLVLLSPGTVLLYLVWLGMLLERRERDDRQWAWALVPILMVALLALMTKNVRYALCLELPIRLGAVLALQRLISLRPSLQGWRIGR